MARITASVYTSHVPAIGAAMDLGKDHEPYWRKLFDGYAYSRRWVRENTPDVIILVYNDHANAFSLSMIPTFAIGTGSRYPIADEGWGPRPVPEVAGDAEFAAHITQSVIQDDFDLTIVNEMALDHGLTVPAVPDVRQGERLALPGHPLRGQRAAVPGAFRNTLFSTRQGHPQGRGVLR